MTLKEFWTGSMNVPYPDYPSLTVDHGGRKVYVPPFPQDVELRRKDV